MTIPIRYSGLDFLCDPDREAAVAEANQQHLISKVGNDTVLNDLRTYLDRRDTIDEAEFDADFLPRLTNLAWIRSLVRGIVSPDFDCRDLVPQLRAFEEPYFNVLELFWHSSLSIFLSVVDAEKAMAVGATDPNFNVMGFTTYLYLLEGGPATIRFFDVSGPEFIADDIDIRAGQLVKVAGRRNSMRFLRCDSDLTVLAINFLAGRSHDTLRYSAKDGSLVRRSTNDVTAQRIFLYSTVLRHMQRADSVEVLGRFLNHDEPSLRWHVMREMLATDTAGAAAALVKMANTDSDEAVRTTATAVLEQHRRMLFPEDPPSSAPA